MKLTKIFLHSFWIVGFLALAFCGILFSSPQKSEVAKADGVPIYYHALSTNTEVAGALYNENSGYSNFVDLTFDKTQSPFGLGGAYQIVDGVVQSLTIDTNVADNSDITAYFQEDYPTTYVDGEELTIGTGLSINGVRIMPELGWYYESANAGGVITLKSLYSPDNSFNGNLPNNFISGGYATDEIHLYCIYNPTSAKLNSGDNGQFYEDDGTTQKDDFFAKIPYLSQQPLLVPRPKNESFYRFDGYFTKNGTRVTNQYGYFVDNNNEVVGWTLNVTELFATYVALYNVNYHYFYNDQTYTGRIQYDKIVNGVWNRINEEKLSRDVLDSRNKASNGTESITFPTDKVIAGWFTKDGHEDGDWGQQKTMFDPSGFDSTHNTFEVWAKVANNAYYLTFDANGGTFWDGETEQKVLCPYNSSLSDAIDSLRTQVGTNELATKVGFKFNIYEWAPDDEQSSIVSLNTKIVDDKTIFLYWRPQKYRIIYYTNGTLHKQGLSADGTYQEINYGENLYDYLSPTSDDIPVYTGYNFIGWATADADAQTSFFVSTRPSTTSFASNGVNLTFIQPTDTMPANNIIVHSVWIKSYTFRLRLNQGTLSESAKEKLKLDSGVITMTMENNETLGNALNRMGVGEFFTDDLFKPTLANCTFVGWCYYSDDNISNNSEDNTTLIDNRLLSMDVDALAAHNIDFTRDSTIAAQYKYNTTDPFYTTAPSDTTSIIFAIALMVISIALLVMLILNHKNNGVIEINDKAIEAYKHIYGDDAPLPTFEATKPPFEVDEDFPTKNTKKNDEKE